MRDRKLPLWLYCKREDDFMRVRRYGSRRPLRVVVTTITFDDGWPQGCVMAAIGRFGVQVGPEDGIGEGFTSMPKGSRCKLVSLGHGRGLGVTWESRAA